MTCAFAIMARRCWATGSGVKGAMRDAEMQIEGRAARVHSLRFEAPRGGMMNFEGVTPDTIMGDINWQGAAHMQRTVETTAGKCKDR